MHRMKALTFSLKKTLGLLVCILELSIFTPHNLVVNTYKFNIMEVKKSQKANLELKKGVFFEVGLTLALALLLLAFEWKSSTEEVEQFQTVAEEQIENIRPGYTDTVLDKSQAEALISGSIRISSGIDNYPETALLFNGGRLKAYKKLMDSFAGNADRYLKEFEESGTEFTLHNIFLKLQEKSRPAVMKTAMILEILVIAIAVIFYSGIILTATGMKKGWFKARNRSLTFGEDVR